MLPALVGSLDSDAIGSYQVAQRCGALAPASRAASGCPPSGLMLLVRLSDVAVPYAAVNGGPSVLLASSHVALDRGDDAGDLGLT